MLISAALTEAINQQVGREFGASLQYVSIASYFEAESLPRLAGFFMRQAEEEKVHALKFVHYINEAGGQVRIPAIAATRYDFKNAEEAVQAALDWEMDVTRHINDLMELAVTEKDHLAQHFLQWFVAEQLEEVSTMSTLLGIVRRAGSQLLFVEDFLARSTLGESSPPTAGE